VKFKKSDMCLVRMHLGMGHLVGEHLTDQRWDNYMRNILSTTSFQNLIVTVVVEDWEVITAWAPVSDVVDEPGRSAVTA